MLVFVPGYIWYARILSLRMYMAVTCVVRLCMHVGLGGRGGE